MVGMIGGATWPLFKGRTGMLLAQISTASCFAVHYALMGAWTGSLMNTLGVLQALAAIPLGTRPSFRRIYLLTLPVIAGGVVVTWHGPPSAFAALGLALISLGRYQTRLLRFRLFLLAAMPCWFGHNILVGSIPGMIADSFGAANNLYMLARIHLEPAWAQRRAERTAGR